MSAESSVGLVETQYFEFAEHPNEMVLESGFRLGPVTLAYETYGTLNEARTNAILITHALSGDAHVAGRHRPDDRKPGWWDAMVGPGKAFDTNRYFVVCSNCLGGCAGSTGPASPNPKTGEAYGLDFPIITIGDMVKAQHELVRHLGIDQLLCVAGGSMGGMQALYWAVYYPTKIRSAMVIASTPWSGAQQIAFDAVGRHAILADGAFKGGRYYDAEEPDRGLAIARMLAHITYLSEESMGAKFGRTLRRDESLRYDFDSEFAVETYLDYQGRQFVNRFDANTYLYVTKAMDYFDISSGFPTLDDAMAQVQSRILVLSFSSDWLYPPHLSEKIVYALARERKDVSYCNIESDYGHDAFLLEVDVMEKVVNGFLAHTMNPDLLRSQVLSDFSDTDTGPPPQSQHSIYHEHRVDYDMIVDLVPPNAEVLDVGCGNGELLRQLIVKKGVRGLGLELSQGHVVSCVRRGISVIQGDIDEGLSSLPDQRFDYVILSMTLQVLRKPEMVLREMLRVGKKAIVTFPNFGFYKVRWNVLTQGRAPVTRNLPYAWDQSPSRHMLSIDDFRRFCEALDIQIEEEIPIYGWTTRRFWPNLLAEEALYVLSSNSDGS